MPKIKNMRNKSRAVVFLHAALAAAAAIAATGIAPISLEQSEKINSAVRIKTNNTELREAVSEATPTIGAFLKINSCLAGYNASVLNAYAAPGKIYPSHNYIGGPMPTMYRHNKSSCVSVLRVHDWSMPTKNSLHFEVVYLAEDSGESSKATHELVKQTNGEWLFSR